ncbi:hypothetical protein WBG78_28495 [Chryseolinea sp. T2]|uniref:hypothetical protein n=1 Tax=Chryseolinea sp. T2 TaxID=3129255 RepID=UPI003077E879
MQIRKQQKTSDYNGFLTDLNTMVFVLNYTTNVMYDAKVKLKPNQTFLEVQLIKLAQHGGSLVDTVRGKSRPTHVSGVFHDYPDISSTYVLARSIIETYLVTYYLNFDNIPADQSNFRKLLFEFAGLKRRQLFAVTTPEGKKQLKKEAGEIATLEQSIKANTYFAKLKSDRKKYLLSGKSATEISIEDIIRARGILNQQFYMGWRLYSNFVHAEYLSTIQLKDYLTDRAALNHTLMAILVDQIGIFTFQINDLLNNFPSCKFAFNMLSVEQRTTFDAWSKLAESRLLKQP